MINVDVKPRGIESAYVDASFDEGKEALVKGGYRIISLEENAGLRMQEGKDAYVSRNGNWTREGFLYIPKRGIFLTKNSPIMANAKEATDCHRKDQEFYLPEFYLDDELIEEGLADSVKIKSKKIPTDRFKDDETAVYVFGKNAEEYGKFLREEAGITEMRVRLADMQKKPFARQMWFRCLDSRSDLGGDVRYLYYHGSVRGVRDSVSAEGTAQNFSEDRYTKMQILSVLNSVGITGKLEQEILGKL